MKIKEWNDTKNYKYVPSKPLSIIKNRWVFNYVVEQIFRFANNTFVSINSIIFLTIYLIISS